jgi:hypothetical protein
MRRVSSMTGEKIGILMLYERRVAKIEKESLDSQRQ